MKIAQLTEGSKSAWPTRKGKWANSYKGGFNSKEHAEAHFKMQRKKDKETTVPVADLAPVK